MKTSRYERVPFRVVAKSYLRCADYKHLCSKYKWLQPVSVSAAVITTTLHRTSTAYSNISEKYVAFVTSDIFLCCSRDDGTMRQPEGAHRAHCSCRGEAVDIFGRHREMYSRAASITMCARCNAKNNSMLQPPQPLNRTYLSKYCAYTHARTHPRLYAQNPAHCSRAHTTYIANQSAGGGVGKRKEKCIAYMMGAQPEHQVKICRQGSLHFCACCLRARAERAGTNIYAHAHPDHQRTE